MLETRYWYNEAWISYKIIILKYLKEKRINHFLAAPNMYAIVRPCHIYSCKWRSTPLPSSGVFHLESKGKQKHEAFDLKPDSSLPGLTCLAHWPIDGISVQVKDRYRPDYSHAVSRSEQD